MELVSIIVPAYNAEDCIARCLESLLDQDYRNIQVVVINDGSKDGTGDIVKELVDKDARIIYCEKENGGVSSARNKGLELSDGEFVTFVDADDYVEEKYISSLVEAIEKYDADICACRIAYHHLVNEGYVQCQKEDDKEEIIRDTDYDFFDEDFTKGVASILFRKKTIEGLRFDRDIFSGEDVLFLARALKNTDRMIKLHKNLYHYNLYAESGSHGTFDRKKRTEFTAWLRIAEMFKDNPLAFDSAMASYSSRCLKVIRRYHFNMGVSKAYYKKKVKQYRQSVKYIIRRLRRKHTLMDIIMGITFLGFAVFPSLYPIYYKFRYHEES